MLGNTPLPRPFTIVPMAAIALPGDRTRARLAAVSSPESIFGNDESSVADEIRETASTAISQFAKALAARQLPGKLGPIATPSTREAGIRGSLRPVALSTLSEQQLVSRSRDTRLSARCCPLVRRSGSTDLIAFTRSRTLGAARAEPGLSHWLCCCCW